MSKKSKISRRNAIKTFALGSSTFAFPKMDRMISTNSKNELCFCLSTHTAKSRKNIDDLKKILPSMISAAANLKKALFKN